MTWKKEYDLRGSDHFSIILKETGGMAREQQKRWNTKRENWTQYQLDSIMEVEVEDQNTIEEAYSSLIQKILYAAENNIPKTTTGIERRPTVLWWNKECQKQERITRAEYKKLRKDPNNKNKIRSFQRRRAIKQREFRRAKNRKE